MTREDRCSYRVEAARAKEHAAPARRRHWQRTCGGAGDRRSESRGRSCSRSGKGRLAPPIPVMPKNYRVRDVSVACGRAAELQNPRCRGLTELRTRLDGLFAQICNNRWCLTSKIAGARHCWLGVERAMRKSKEEAAETRARIIRKASKEFNQHGIAGTGLADVMKSAGLTHGGFYKHFQSKDELVAEALERGLEQSFQAIHTNLPSSILAE